MSATTEAPRAKARSSRSVGDMFLTLAVIAGIVLVLVILGYRSPGDPVRPVDASAVAAAVSSVAAFDVLLPTDQGWTATSARWEVTEDSGGAEVWFTGGVYSADGPFASVSQSSAGSERYLREQTSEGKPVGESTVAGTTWQRYESAAGNRSLVLVVAGCTTVVEGTGAWTDIERFTGSLRIVSEPAPQA